MSEQTTAENTKKKVIYDATRCKKHKIYYYIFLILSILGLLDIGTHGATSNTIGLLFGIINIRVGAVVTVLLNLIFSFAILWIPIAIIEYKTFKKIETAKTGDN